jgi:hypothetical protein
MGDDAAPRTGSVDWEEPERRLAERPRRDPDKPRRRRPTAPLSVRITGSDQADNPLEVQLTVISSPGARRSLTRHVQKRVPFRPTAKPIEVDDVELGDYIVVARMRGYRPIATVAPVRKDGLTLDLEPPLIPARNIDEERELLRVGEVHPHIEATRAFLDRFGYGGDHLACGCPAERFCPHLEPAMRLYQETQGLRVTGSLTIETLALMMRPRCRVPDFGAEEWAQAASRSRATDFEQASSGPGGTTKEDPFVFSSQHWDDTVLTYRLLDGTGDITNEWPIIRGSMQRWADVSPLSFTQTTGAPSHLEFDFRRPSESDYPFDEGGTKSKNTLAHGFFPNNGLVEFDDHEDWDDDFDLTAVATHEVGHALGLRHSSDKNASMYATYHSGQKTLKELDVRGIKSLYAPVVRRNDPFIAYPLFAFDSTHGTDTVTIDLGTTRDFLAWGTINLYDTLTDFDRDNMAYVDVFEVDGERTTWRASGGDHFGSATCPANVHEGAVVRRGRTVMFRMVAGHHSDLSVSGYGMVLILN